MNSRRTTGGVKVLTVVGIVFIVLKWTGNIDWSWWWVLAPFWPTALLIAALTVWFLLAFTSAVVRSWQAEGRKRRRVHH